MKPISIWTILIAAATICGGYSCTEEDGAIVIDKTQRDTVTTIVRIDSLGAVPPEVLSRCLPVDGWDFPVGPPDAKKYYKARGFLGMEHLGEDWNGPGGGNTDFGDYVYAAADGVVWEAKDYGGGWGLVIRMVHNIGTMENPDFVESVSAHVSQAWARTGNRMKRGEVIGTIGNASGKYHAHLHYEIRRAPGKHIRAGYDGDTIGFVDPTKFIEGRRPAQR